MDLSRLAAEIASRVFSAILSFLDSANLRNRLFEVKNEHELMWTALDDIARMDKDGKLGQYARQTLTKIKNGYAK